MSKAIEEKINVVKRYLQKCNSVYNCYTYGNIPRDKFNNACMSYAGHMEYEECIGLIDETLFGSGKRGMIFGINGFYKDSQKGIMLYKDDIQWESLGDTYNLNIMNEMLEKLYEIDTRPSGWDIAGGLLKGAWDLYQASSGNIEIDDDDLNEDDEDLAFFMNGIQHCTEHIKELEICVNDALAGDLKEKLDAISAISDLLTDDHAEFEGEEVMCEKMVDGFIMVLTDDNDIDGVEQINFEEKTIEIYQCIAEILSKNNKNTMGQEFDRCFKKYQIILRTARRTLKHLKDYIEEEYTE